MLGSGCREPCAREAEQDQVLPQCPRNGADSILVRKLRLWLDLLLHLSWNHDRPGLPIEAEGFLKVNSPNDPVDADVWPSSHIILLPDIFRIHAALERIKIHLSSLHAFRVYRTFYPKDDRTSSWWLQRIILCHELVYYSGYSTSADEQGAHGYD